MLKVIQFILTFPFTRKRRMILRMMRWGGGRPISSCPPVMGRRGQIMQWNVSEAEDTSSSSRLPQYKHNAKIKLQMQIVYKYNRKVNPASQPARWERGANRQSPTVGEDFLAGQTDRTPQKAIPKMAPTLLGSALKNGNGPLWDQTGKKRKQPHK